MSNVVLSTFESFERAHAEFALLIDCATVCAVSIVISVVAYYAIDTLDTTPLPIAIPVGIAFVIVCIAPIVLLPIAVFDVAAGPQRARRFLWHLVLFIVAFIFNPLAQQASGIDWTYAVDRRERSESLHVVGKSQEEAVALLGPPSYVHAIQEAPGEVQLRYQHPLPMLWSAEFFVSVKDGRVQYVHIDPD